MSMFVGIPACYLTHKIQHIIRGSTVVHEDITNYHLTENV